MASSPTLKDVARLAGVHPGTASRALNPDAQQGVSARTVEAVLKAAQQLGYSPDPIARSLRTQRSNIVGLLVPDLTNPLFPPIARGAEDALRERGYTTLIANTDNDENLERQLFKAMRGRRVDGFLIATARRHDPLIESASSQGVPLVQINRTTDSTRIPAVLGDDAGGVAAAVQHLVSLGHSRIGHLSGPPAFSTGYERMRAFLDTCRRMGLAVPAESVVECSAYSIEAGTEAMRVLLRQAPSLTAVVAGNDLIALGAVDALAAAGLKVPDDVSVVGFNDMPFADRMQPPLTTIAVPQYHIGVEAARMLLERLQNPTAPPKRLLLPSELVLRKSTAPPPQR